MACSIALIKEAGWALALCWLVSVFVACWFGDWQEILIAFVGAAESITKRLIAVFTVLSRDCGVVECGDWFRVDGAGDSSQGCDKVPVLSGAGIVSFADLVVGSPSPV